VKRESPARHQNELVLVDRTGNLLALAVPSPEGRYSTPRFSPDGGKVAVRVYGENDYRIWIYDLERDTLDPLTQVAWGIAGDPLWSVDGTRVAFDRYVERRIEIAWIAADGSGQPEVLVVEETAMRPLGANAFSPDGKALVYQQQRTGETEWDIVALPLDGTGAPKDFVASPSSEGTAEFSPGGRWGAYVSDETGGTAVYVRPYPDPGSAIRTSKDGGGGPVWGPNGRELFYINSDRLMVAEVEANPTFVAGEPCVLTELDPGIDTRGVPSRGYDISPDGQRFIFVRIVEGSFRSPQWILALNWFEELKRLAPREQ
jgi:Tol biopolymer transport system component